MVVLLLVLSLLAVCTILNTNPSLERPHHQAAPHHIMAHR